MTSKTALEHPKMAPSRPREVSKPASEGIRRARHPPRRPKMALRWPKTVRGPPGRSEDAKIANLR
eukprot:572643-Pyramimonas_sp.AAC.1